DQATREALEKASGLPSTSSTRLELARAVAERELLPRLARGGYQVQLYAFSDSASILTDLSGLSGKGSATHLGDALAQALAAQRGGHLTDVVVISDGRSNGGQPVLDAARSAGSAGVPVHALIVGDTRSEKNAVLELVDAPGEALEGDELGVTVRLRGRGT